MSRTEFHALMAMKPARYETLPQPTPRRGISSFPSEISISTLGTNKTRDQLAGTFHVASVHSTLEPQPLRRQSTSFAFFGRGGLTHINCPPTVPVHFIRTL